LNNSGGSNNTGTGRQALFSSTFGFNNTATGGDALFSNTIGGSNTANGYQALFSNTTGMRLHLNYGSQRRRAIVTLRKRPRGAVNSLLQAVSS
jgi:hypothetical protein